MLQPIASRLVSKSFAKVHVRLEDVTSGRSGEVFSDSLSERQKTGSLANFFVCDVVQPVDAECSTNHLLMTSIEHVWHRRIEGRETPVHMQLSL